MSEQAPPPENPPSEEELQRRLEEQVRRLRVQELLTESVVSILNLAARRIAKEDERDLEQGRIGIEAVRALVDLLDEGPREQVREALSQVQMLYVRETQGGGGAESGGGEPGGGEPGPEPQAPDPGGERRGSEPPPRLWTPPGSS